MNDWFLSALLVSVGLTACSKYEEPAAMPTQPTASATYPNSGRILQLMQATGYTYAEVQAGDGQKVWMAGALLALKVGDIVQWGDYAVMRGFRSKALNRTFEQILFVNAWGAPGGASAHVAPHGAQPANQVPSSSQAAAETRTTPVEVSVGTVKSVALAGGYTYLEVDQNGAAVWVAAPETLVKPGDKVTWQGGVPMQNFTAKSLGRTFEQIIFVGNASVIR